MLFYTSMAWSLAWSLQNVNVILKKGEGDYTKLKETQMECMIGYWFQNKLLKRIF